MKDNEFGVDPSIYESSIYGSAADILAKIRAALNTLDGILEAAVQRLTYKKGQSTDVPCVQIKLMNALNAYELHQRKRASHAASQRNSRRRTRRRNNCFATLLFTQGNHRPEKRARTEIEIGIKKFPTVAKSVYRFTDKTGNGHTGDSRVLP